MDVRADRDSDAVTVISALLLWLIKSYFDIWNSASRASLTTLKKSTPCSLGYDTNYMKSDLCKSVFDLHLFVVWNPIQITFLEIGFSLTGQIGFS